VQTFTLDPRRWWIGRLWTRNPLLRLGDRIEVLAILAALVVSLLGIAVAGAVGTEIHDAERRADAELARTRQSVSATVVDVGTVTNFDGSQKAMVQARWAAGNDPHTDSFQWGTKVQPGDRIQIWVDNRGDYVDLPRPLRPVLDACTVAISIVLLVISMLAVALALLRWRLERGRDAQWDREIRSLASEDGGRANGATPGKSP
jgi:hypothetical protein